MITQHCRLAAYLLEGSWCGDSVVGFLDHLPWLCKYMAHPGFQCSCRTAKLLQMSEGTALHIKAAAGVAHAVVAKYLQRIL